jgi:hypothetical protein
MTDTVRVRRIVVVTLSLAGAGAIAGGLCGVVAGVVATSIEGGHWSIQALRDLAAISTYASAFGAIAGAVAFPLAGWGLLRQVSIGRAIMGTAIGTVIGSALGELYDPFNPYIADAPGIIVGGFMGFVFAAALLRVLERARRAKSSAVAV